MYHPPALSLEGRVIFLRYGESLGDEWRFSPRFIGQIMLPPAMEMEFFSGSFLDFISDTPTQQSPSYTIAQIPPLLLQRPRNSGVFALMVT